VVASDLRLGGFNGEWGEGPAIQRKREKLMSEGVVFEGENGGRIRSTCVHKFVLDESAEGGGERGTTTQAEQQVEAKRKRGLIVQKH